MSAWQGWGSLPERKRDEIRAEHPDIDHVRMLYSKSRRYGPGGVEFRWEYVDKDQLLAELEREEDEAR